MTAPNGNQAPNPYATIGLPAVWAPGPVNWTFAKLDVMTPAGRQTVHVLILDTVSGRQGYAFTGDDLRRLAAALAEQATGLTIAGPDQIG